MPSSGLLKDGRVLVTGASGVLGSQLVAELCRRGCAVRAFVRTEMGARAGQQGDVDWVNGDVRVPAAVTGAAAGCKVIFHLAALNSGISSYCAARDYVEMNVLGTLHVLQAAREAGARVILASTADVYGAAEGVLDESTPLAARTPYAASKVAAEQFAQAFYHLEGGRVIVLRLFNCYGPGQRPRAVVPSIITQLASGSGEIKLGNVDVARDFLHVSDAIAAFIAAADSPDVDGEIFNIGGGTPITILELARLTAAAMGKNLRIQTDDTRLRLPNTEPALRCACSDKAMRRMGWRAMYAGMEGLKRGLNQTIQASRATP